MTGQYDGVTTHGQESLFKLKTYFQEGGLKPSGSQQMPVTKAITHVSVIENHLDHTLCVQEINPVGNPPGKWINNVSC
jgi:hypothetical protein